MITSNTSIPFIKAENSENKFYLSRLTSEYNEGDSITTSTAINCRKLAIAIEAGDKITINGTSLTVYADAAVDATSFFVEAITLDEALNINANIAIDEDNMFVQYQRKTEGTVAGFDIDADGMSKGGVEITGWLDSDTMEGATANNLPTAESVKAYVDAQVGASDTLQEVTDNGNTTTNSVMIGSASSPTLNLEVIGGYDATPVKFLRHATYGNIIRLGRNGVSETAHIGYPADATINFSTSGSEKMRIDSSGNVGIGTTSPSAKLQVNGNGTLSGEVQIYSDSTTSHALFRIVNNNNIATAKYMIGYGSSHPSQANQLSFKNSVGDFTFFNASSGSMTEKMRITSDGNVGIGTTSPDAPLQVGSVDTSFYSLSSGKSIIIGDNYNLTETQRGTLDLTSTQKTGGNNTGLGPSLTFSQNVSQYVGGYEKVIGAIKTIINTSSNTSEKSAMLFSTHNGSSLSERMRINDTGNVGIGTTSPGTKLHVGTGSGATVDTGYQIVADSPGIAGIQILAANNQSSRVIFGDADDNDVGMIKYDHTDNSMGFRTNGSGNERMRITSDGNVGIGTTSPSAKFHIDVDSEDNQPALLIEKASDKNETALVVKHISSSNLRGIADFQNTSGSVMKILADGNVGIGTTSPDQMLHISGLFPRIKLQDTDAANTLDHSLIEQNDGVLRFRNDPSYLSNNSAIQFDIRGSEKMRITSSGNVLIGTTTDSGEKLQVSGNAAFTGQVTATEFYVVNNNFGLDTSGNYLEILGYDGFKFRNSQFNALSLTIEDNGNLLLGTTTDSGYKLDVNGTQRVQDVLELDDVLTLNAISTPDDPADGKSSIYMDSADGAIKVKINFEGEVVTRTIASFDG